MNFIYKYGLFSDDSGTLLLDELQRYFDFESLIYDYKKEGRIIKKYISKSTGGFEYQYVKDGQFANKVINFKRIKIVD